MNKFPGVIAYEWALRDLKGREKKKKKKKREPP